MNQKKKRLSSRLYLYFVFVVLVSISTSMLWSFQLSKNNSLFFMPSYEDSLHDLPSTQQQNELLPVLDDDMKVAQKLEVLKTDKIMSSQWDSAIVLQKCKLVFFGVPKVGSTTWKFFFRRVEGQADWQSQENGLPHDPKKNSLVYLNQFNTSYVAEIMQDPSWTKAIFVRDPKKRFLSAFLNKAQRNEGKWIGRCCRQFRIPGEKDMRKMPSFLKCIEDGRKDLPGFLKMTETCHNGHWEPITNRIDSKYWKYINYMGKMENLAEDGTRLLKRLGNDVWETYGQSGWGKYGNSSMFDKPNQIHVTGANDKLLQWYTRETERMVEERFAKDYNMFQYEKTSLVGNH